MKNDKVEQWFCGCYYDAEEENPLYHIQLVKATDEEECENKIYYLLDKRTRDFYPHNWCVFNCHLATKQDFEDWKNYNRTY